MRVPDLPKLLRLIASVLEGRLVRSVAAGWSGELKLSFSRNGLRLCFEGGRLAVVEPWSPVQDQESACFRDLTFLQLLFGSRSLQELRDASPECYACDHEARALLNILFPKRPSAVWAST